MKFEATEINYFGGMLQIPLPPNELEKAQHLQQACSKGKTLTVEVKQKVKQRSLTANSYCWVLCDLIAKRIRSTKEEIYQYAIKRVGVFETVLVKHTAIAATIGRWQLNGVGWVGIDLGPNKNALGYSSVALYYGSSTYTQEEMGHLLDFLYDEAEKLGCDVLSEADKDLLVNDWRTK